MFAFGQTYLSEWIGQKVAYDIRNRIYDRLQRLSYAYHDQQQTGETMSRATQDVEAVRWYISMGVLRGSYVFLLLIAVLVLMMVMSWQLALVVWAFIPFIIWRSSVMAFTLRPLWMKIQEGLGKLANVLQTALTGARGVKSFGRGEHGGEATILAGGPWFGDWGRGSFIALEGLLLSPGRYQEARQVLATFAGAQRDGLIPNRFDDYGRQCAYTSVDASLWFIHAADAYLRYSDDPLRWAGSLLGVRAPAAAVRSPPQNTGGRPLLPASSRRIPQAPQNGRPPV